MDSRRRIPRVSRSGRALVAVLIYLVIFAGLLLVVGWAYVTPALTLARNGAPADRAKLAAGAVAMLIMLLFALAGGLLITLRIGHYFFPRPQPHVKKTSYPDAWAEAARRMPTPPPEE